MPVTPTGIVSGALGSVRTMLSENDAFQTLVGAADATAALGSIHLAAEHPENLTRPYVVLDESEQWSYGVLVNQARGTIMMLWEIPVATGSEHLFADPQLTASNALGAIMAELGEQSLEGGALLIREIRKTSGPARPDAKERRRDSEDFVQYMFEADWGLEG